MKFILCTKCWLHQNCYKINEAFVENHLTSNQAMGYRHREGLSVPQSCSTAALNYIEATEQHSSHWETVAARYVYIENDLPLGILQVLCKVLLEGIFWKANEELYVKSGRPFCLVENMGLYFFWNPCCTVNVHLFQHLVTSQTWRSPGRKQTLDMTLVWCLMAPWMSQTSKTLTFKPNMSDHKSMTSSDTNKNIKTISLNRASNKPTKSQKIVTYNLTPSISYSKSRPQVARQVAEVYSLGMPQAVELVRRRLKWPLEKMGQKSRCLAAAFLFGRFFDKTPRFFFWFLPIFIFWGFYLKLKKKHLGCRKKTYFFVQIMAQIRLGFWRKNQIRGDWKMFRPGWVLRMIVTKWVFRCGSQEPVVIEELWWSSTGTFHIFCTW